jgi:Fic family protein
VKTFVPHPLPPEPSLVWDASLQALSQRAMLAVGRLDGLTALLPDVSQFLYTYIRKEAVLSSQIEGTQSSLDELLLFETEEVPGVPSDDVIEVSNYVAAMEHGLKRLREGFPLSLRLIREIHGVLLARGRGSQKQPGGFRTSQNWIGGTRPGNALFVPPPPDQVIECMGALEKYLHNDPVQTPPLLKAALSHVQFETIHPFLDGNGRVGRLLITFLLCHEGVLQQPLLYLSLFLKQHRKEYYELLQRVRTEGVWEEWLAFFFEGVSVTADQAADTARRILRLFQENQCRIVESGAAPSVARVHELLRSLSLERPADVCHREFGVCPAGRPRHRRGKDRRRAQPRLRLQGLPHDPQRRNGTAVDRSQRRHNEPTKLESTMATNYELIREANIKAYGEETRHLAFFGKLYAERTHFIFELLQNAEDAGAKEVLFRLLPDHLDVLHNGRPGKH